MLWRTGAVLGLILGAAVLAYQIGSRLSDQAIMTLLGVLCGVAASIPVSIGLLLALTRKRHYNYGDGADDVYQDPAPAAYPVYRPTPPTPPQPPQIIVVAPPQGQLPPNYNPYSNYLLPPPAATGSTPMQERSFRIVGEDEGD